MLALEVWVGSTGGGHRQSLGDGARGGGFHNGFWVLLYRLNEGAALAAGFSYLARRIHTASLARHRDFQALS